MAKCDWCSFNASTLGSISCKNGCSHKVCPGCKSSPSGKVGLKCPTCGKPAGW